MSQSRLIRGFVVACAFVGTASRLLPLLDPSGRGLRQFPSEDGYLMLTIARNLALGRGLSIEAGTTMTNGTQPLMTFVYGGLFWWVDGDRTAGVALAQVVGLVVAILAALLLYRLANTALKGDPDGQTLAAVVAATWYVSPLSTRFTQNCLETGATTLVPLLLALFFLRRKLDFDRPWPVGDCVAIGGLLGLAFWIRNDAVLASVAVCSALLLSGVGRRGPGLGRRVLESASVGTTALLVVSPWLVYNHLLFGSIVPVSGISQGAEGLAENLVRVPAILAEQISMVMLIPVRWETRPIVLVAASLAVLVWLLGVFREAASMERAGRQWLGLLAVWATLHVGFYGVIYGAGYFMGRYLFPLSTWTALLSVWLVHRVWQRAGSPQPRLLAPLCLAAIVIVSIGLDARMFRRGRNNGHFQIVEWVDRHVPEDVWVGAIQSGTLGFFHDRTFNLDGKVSPPALRAKLEGRTFDYVLSHPMQYLVDWTGIATWLEDPAFDRRFELLVYDEERNLAVLARRDS